MKRSRFNEEEVIGILREGESGSSVKAVCAKHNIKADNRVLALVGATTSLAMILLLIPKLGINAVPIGLIAGFVPFILGGSILEVIESLLNPHRQYSAPREQSQFHQATLL
jgi:hypothetical protein